VAGELLDGAHPLEAFGEQLDRLASGQVEGKILFDPTLEG
jgi:(R,R)-butanediol dehydrogenase/meso-butanediol dehydrogenase/diacetyl reductase